MMNYRCPTNGEDMERENRNRNRNRIQATDKRACREQNGHFASQATLISRK
jgi:hypothetical protein